MPLRLVGRALPAAKVPTPFAGTVTVPTPPAGEMKAHPGIAGSPTCHVPAGTLAMVLVPAGPEVTVLAPPEGLTRLNGHVGTSGSPGSWTPLPFMSSYFVSTRVPSAGATSKIAVAVVSGTPWSELKTNWAV